MKLNFWQIIGLVLLLIGLIGMIWVRTRPAESPATAPPAPVPAATTLPATQPG